MATYVQRSEALVTCPFNSSHQVKRGRLCIHIAKCRKRYPEQDVKGCPYSADHVVPASEFLHHLRTCPKNTTVKKYLIEPTDGASVAARSLSEGVRELRLEHQDTEEVWGDADRYGEVERKVVLPDVQPVFRNVQSMAPAERRAYYASLFHTDTSTGTRAAEAETEPVMPSVSQPRTEPKVLQMTSDRRAQQLGFLNAGAGRGQRSSAASCKAPMSTSAKLLGLGRGRGMNAGST